ncbi:MAG: hypothetical protein WD066_17140 [Planctomycetaceae bacterium]
MSQSPSNDPVLRELESQLTQLAPRLSRSEQSALLYQCAFAAGRKSGVRGAHRWRWTSAALGVLLLGSLVPRPTEPTQEIASHQAPAPEQPSEETQAARPAPYPVVSDDDFVAFPASDVGLLNHWKADAAAESQAKSELADDDRASQRGGQADVHAREKVEPMEEIDPRIEEIRRKWADRATRARSVKIQWTEQDTRPKEHRVAVGPMNQMVPVGREITLDHEKSFIASGDKFRYTSKGALWHAGANSTEPQPMEWTAVWNRYGRSLFHFTNFVPNATLHDHPPMDVTTRPLMYALWPLTPHFGHLDLDEYRIKEAPAVIAGRQCVVLERNTGPVENELYVDMQRDCLILRVVGASTPRQADIQYEKDASGNWHPSGWQYVSTKTGGSGFDISIVAKTTAVDFSYTAQPADFEIDYPPGTILRDNRARPAPDVVQHPAQLPGRAAEEAFIAQELARRASVPDHLRYRVREAPHDREAEFAEHLAAFERLDPAARALTVGSLTRSLQESL